MRRKPAFVALLLVPLLVAGLVVAGCGGKETEQEAEARLVSSLEEFEVALKGMLNPNIYTNQDLFDDAWGEVKDSYNEVVDAAGSVKDIRITAFTDAYGNLKDAVGNITSDQSLQEKAAAISSALTELQDAWKDLFSELEPEDQP